MIIRLSFLIFVTSLSTLSIAQLELIGTVDGYVSSMYLSDNEIVFYDRTGNETFDLYNSDLSLLTSVTIPIEWNPLAPYYVYFVSRDLFDWDPSNIEYMLTRSAPEVEDTFVRIIREDGSILFDLPEYRYTSSTRWFQYPAGPAGIIEDENGVVFTFTYGTGSLPTAFYRSCGSIPRSCPPCAIDSLMTDSQNFQQLQGSYNIFPNPGNDHFRIEYELPRSVSSAWLCLYDMQGREVLNKQVGASMPHILVNTSDLNSGRYQLILRTNEQALISESYIELD